MATGTAEIRRALDKVETATELDAIADPVQGIVDRLIRGRLRALLGGTWLGHPLHPVLVQVPMGAWMSASVMDMLPGSPPAATVLVGVGTAAAVPAVAAGWTDWSSLAPEQRRVGLVHASTIVIAVGLQTASLVARLRGRDKAGRQLSLAALSLAGAGAYIGGHLAYRQAANVNHGAPQLRLISDGWHDVCALDDLRDENLVVRAVDDVPVLLVRDGDAVTAMIERCAHQAGPLGDGEIASIHGEKCVICPLHGSAFRLVDGMVVRGPAATDQPLLRSRVQGGRVEVALP